MTICLIYTVPDVSTPRDFSICFYLSFAYKVETLNPGAAYAEPWYLDRLCNVRDADGMIVVDPQGSDHTIYADAVRMRHIIACVNLCAGVETHRIEAVRRGLLEFFALALEFDRKAGVVQ